MSLPRRIEVSVDDQRLDVFDDDRLIRSFKVSTASKGVGFQEGSYRTPTGRLAVVEMIGGGQPKGTIFKARVPIGIWTENDTSSKDLVLSRILWLDGLDPENANTRRRYIYIHGTNHEDLLGEPASQGCIRVSNDDMLELYQLAGTGMEVIVHPPVRSRGRLLFLDCDSTLSSIEGIDELARSGGPEVYAEVVALTHAAMNGEVAIDEVFSRRMDIIRPNRAACERVASQYLETITPGAAETIEVLKADGWLPVILSGGFAPLILPLARELGIEHLEAVPLYLDGEGNYAGYGSGYPTTRNSGKNEVIREWKKALLPELVVMVGDGISDLETAPDVDLFVGYGGVISRPRVRESAGHWLTEFPRLRDLLKTLAGPVG